MPPKRLNEIFAYRSQISPIRHFLFISKEKKNTYNDTIATF